MFALLTRSLFGVLNHCKTGAGSRMLRAALIQPSTDMDTITARHDCVVELLAREDALVDLQMTMHTQVTFSTSSRYALDPAPYILLAPGDPSHRYYSSLLYI